MSGRCPVRVCAHRTAAALSFSCRLQQLAVPDFALAGAAVHHFQ
jgi:hypothetical protein